MRMLGVTSLSGERLTIYISINLTDCIISPLRDGEMIAVEVVAVDCKAALETVVWLGCVQYDGLRRVWETRASQTVSQRLSQTNLLSIFGTSKVTKTVTYLLLS